MDKELADDVSLNVTVDASGVVHMFVGGNVTDDHIREFSEWADHAKEVIKGQYTQTGALVFTLIDVSRLEQFDIQTTKIVHDLLVFDRDYVARTGIFGANYVASLMLEAIIAITKRENVKLFPKKEAAVEWLQIGIPS
jgi:hypothetical protein